MVYWICSVGHEWQESVSNRTKRHKADCKVCNSIGYRMSSLQEEWDIANKESFYEISANSNKKIIWKCKQCYYLWRSSVANRFRGSGCPKRH